MTPLRGRLGGPLPVVVASAGKVQGGAALPVRVVSEGTLLSTEAGPAFQVVDVTNLNGPVVAGPPIPVFLAPPGAKVEGGPAIPVVVVEGSLDSIMAYTNKVKALGPIAYYPQAEPSGTTIVDESGNGRNGTYVGVTLGQPGIGDGRTAAGYGGVMSYGNIYSASLAGAFNGAEGSLVTEARVANAGVWTDGAFRDLVRILVDANNFVALFKTNTNNTLSVGQTAGGVSKTISTNALGGTTIPFSVALTWSKTADQVKIYINGTQIGSTLTGLGTWTGSLSPTRTTIGATSTVPTVVWHGILPHTAIFNRALSAAEIASLAVVP